MYNKKSPYEVEVKADQSSWICQCGKSQNAPYCDGSHKGSSQEPYEHKSDEDSSVYVCGCGQSKTMPWCDGTHNSL